MKRSVLVVAGLLAVAGIGRLSFAQGWEPTEGQEATVSNAQTETTVVALNSKAWTALKQAYLANDKVGVEQLIKGKAAAPVPNGTSVLVLRPVDRRQMARPVDGRMRTVSVPTSWEVRVKDGDLKDQVVFLSAISLVRPGSSAESAAASKKSSKTFQADREANKASNAFRAARRLESEGKAEAALNSYKAVVKQYPESPEARMATARVKALSK